MAPKRTGEADSDDDAFPTQQLAVLALCRVAEPIAFTSILAYTYVMVQDIKGDEDASFYAGLLVSAFAVAEASTAMVWGAISDRYGRKPIILIGLAGTALSSLLFGFATKYWVALLARVVGGLLNGNVAVMQTMVAEMVKRPEHEPKAYAVQPFMWSLGSIIGSAMGGFTAQPSRYYPSIFPPDGIFGRFPYLLPNLVAVIAIMLAIIQAMIFLKETNPRSKSQSRGNESGPVDERTPLQQNQSDRRKSVVDMISTGPRRPSFIAGAMPTVNEPSFDLRRSSMGSITSLGSFQPITRMMSTIDTVMEEPSQQVPDDPAKPPKAFNRGVIMWTIALVIMCYHQMAFLSVVPIYLLDDPFKASGLDLRGGLGYTVHDVGSYLAINGLFSLFIQGLIFPFYVGKLGIWKSVVSLTFMTPIVLMLPPFLSFLPNPGAGVYVVLFLQNFITTIVYPCLLILLKNATESPLVLGKVNGLAMSACSGARTIAPPLVGIIYSSIGSAAAWWSCAIFAVFGIIELYFIPRPEEAKGAMSRHEIVEPAMDPSVAAEN